VAARRTQNAMNKSRARVLLLCGIGIASGAMTPQEPLSAQARYDGHELRDRVKLAMGGFHTENTTTTLRVDSRRFALGTLLEVENRLNVEDSVTGGRLDGFYRFDRANRIEWTYYSQSRKGSKPLLDEELRIGDVVIPIDYSLESELGFDIAKIGYAWSFVNTRTYELFLGAGLNVRDVRLKFSGEGLLAGRDDTRVFETQEALPLPTLTAGIRYSIGDRWEVHFRAESFFLGVDENRGRMQDTYLLGEYDFSKNFGIGAGLNAYNVDLEMTLDEGRAGKIESSYLGFLLYLTARF
jgi:hypothetical protein